MRIKLWKSEIKLNKTQKQAQSLTNKPKNISKNIKIWEETITEEKQQHPQHPKKRLIMSTTTIFSIPFRI